MKYNMLHSFSIVLFRTLASCGPDGRTTTEIENFCLKGGCICVLTHLATESVNFIDEMTFCETADRWIAGHSRDG